MKKRYKVSFPDSDISIEFNDLQEARHYARMNGGKVWDKVRWHCVYDYTDSDED